MYVICIMTMCMGYNKSPVYAAYKAPFLKYVDMTVH
jgi:hypothetical protein